MKPAAVPPPLPDDERRSLAAAGLALHFDTQSLVKVVEDLKPYLVALRYMPIIMIAMFVVNAGAMLVGLFVMQRLDAIAGALTVLAAAIRHGP